MKNMVYCFYKHTHPLQMPLFSFLVASFCEYQKQKGAMGGGMIKEQIRTTPLPPLLLDYARRGLGSSYKLYLIGFGALSRRGLLDFKSNEYYWCPRNPKHDVRDNARSTQV